MTKSNAPITVLKNQNKTLTLNFEKEIVKETVTYTLKTLDVVNGEGKTETFESDENGKAVNSVDLVPIEPSMSLQDYCDKLKRDYYKSLLKGKYNEIENLAILSGAGSSVGVGNGNVGLTMAGLWKKMESIDLACLTRLIKTTKYSELKEDGSFDSTNIEKDLEALLSIAGMKSKVDKDDQLDRDILRAREIISEFCDLKLSDDAPHIGFLNKAILRPQKFPRVKVFTLNYDTLFEQSAAKEKYTVIDGFTFSFPRTFNGKYFDYDIIETRHNRQDKKDSTVPKLFYLFKMHGSLNWIRTDSDIEQTDGKIEVEDRVMIFPQDSKYEHSYEQPYFEMMARFQQTLRIENSLLITIGFSFIDKHISSVILETLKQNPSLHLIVLTYPDIVYEDKSYQKELHRIAELQSRVTLVAETFAEFSKNFPENIAHNRVDVLEELNSQLKKLAKRND